MLALLAAGFLTLACCGCETTQEKSAALERGAKHAKVAPRRVSVSRESPSVKVLASAVVHSNEGTAAVVALRDTSRHALENAPLELTVSDAKGSVLYQNNAAGLQPSLTKVSSLEPGKDAVWVDDQVPATGTPAVSARVVVGEASAVTSVPKLAVVGAKLSGAGAEASESGNVTNHSSLTQTNLVVYAVARRTGKVVAAGRAVLPEVAAGTSVPFQIYFVGDPRGAQIQMSAPATTF